MSATRAAPRRTKTETHICGTGVAAGIAVPAGAVSATPLLHHRKRLSVLHVGRFHIISCLEVLHCFIQPALLIRQVAGQKIPFGRLPWCGTQKLFCLDKISHIDTLPYLTIQSAIVSTLLLVGVLPLVLLALKPIVARTCSATASGTGNGGIGFIDFFHFFLG